MVKKKKKEHNKNQKENEKKLKDSKKGFTLDTYKAMEDFIFSKYMVGEGNQVQQRELLETLGINITGEIIAIDTNMPPDIYGKKSSRFDCHLKTTCNKKINIECQQKDEDDFKNRLVHYLSKALTSSLNKGDDYDFSDKAIGVAICDFPLTKSKSHHTTFTIKNNDSHNNEEFTDIMEIHIIEMPKFRKMPMYKQIKKYLKKKKQKQYITILKEFQYLFFLDNKTSHEERKEIVKMGNEGLNIAIKRIEEALQNEDAYDIYMNQKIEEIHQNNIIKQKEKKSEEKGREKGIEEGREKGIEEGREEGIIITATKMKNRGISIEEIAEITNLTPKFIKTL